MTDPARLAGGLAHPRLDYFTSQFIVVAHYLANFILPIDLSADPDFKVTSEIFTIDKILSLILILGLHGLAIYSATKKNLVPIAFGILWFFITLAPTSTINPLYQVTNDHRTFLPYIGLCLSAGWVVYLLYQNLTSAAVRKALIAAVFVVFAGHAYGTYQRNVVWGSSETLWYDAVQKGPTNGRAQMNYGLVKMRDGEYEEAEIYFKRAVEILPYWPYSNINMAILMDAMGNKSEAIKYFELGLRYGRDNPEPYYFLARFYMKHGELDKALRLLQDGHSVSPKHANINRLLADLKSQGISPEEKLKNQLALVASNPTADNYINLSLLQYKQKDYVGCINSCNKALELNPNSAVAYNNICSAHNAMQQWKSAAEACTKALEINPEFERAKNNLVWAEGELAKQ